MCPIVCVLFDIIDCLFLYLELIEKYLLFHFVDLYYKECLYLYLEFTKKMSEDIQLVNVFLTY